MGGIMATRDAMRLAEEHGQDLVEISPNADPPVCRIMDFGKFRYDEALKKKKARRQSMTHNRAVKEIKFHANVAEHDYLTKLTHTREFLEKGHKVKLTLQFRGRENAHKELGMQVVHRVIKDCDLVGTLEMEPKVMGRSVFAMLGPKPRKQGQAAPSYGPPSAPPKPVIQKPAQTGVAQPAPVVVPEAPVEAIEADEAAELVADEAVEKELDAEEPDALA